MNPLFALLQAATLDEGELLGIQTLSDAVMTTSETLAELGLRFGLNLLACFVLVHFFYYRKSRRRDYYFTFIAFSSAMLLLLFMMGNVEVGVGLTLGLFAIFGVIRYRTETVPIREMTYLFVIIALAAVNGLSSVYTLQGAMTQTPEYALNWGSIGIMASANVLMIIIVWLLESTRFMRVCATRLIQYDRIELIVPQRREELIADLQKRTGLKIDNVEIGFVDFLKDSAFIKIYYTLQPGETNTIGLLTKPKDFLS